MFDLICIGDTTPDVFLDLDEASVICDIDKDACKLCINYADKVPVKSIHEVHAVGNAANVAVGATRLELNAALYTLVGDDDQGEHMRAELKGNGVSPDYIQTDPGKRSNYSVVINYKGERTIFVYHEPRNYVLPHMAPTKWVYYTSVGKEHEKLNASVVEYIKAHDAKLAYNPGSHQIRAGFDTMREIISACEIIFVNKQEAEQILGIKGKMSVLQDHLYALGATIVVITDSENGSFVFDGNKRYHAPIIPAPVIEKTGAGDSFACAFLCALHHGYGIQDAMRWGSMNAASVIQHVGAQEGLLTRKKLHDMLAEHGLYDIEVMK